MPPAPQRVRVDPAVVRQLIEEQFPRWADLPVRAVDQGGWDNFTFHLGAEMSARLPSAAEYALAVEKEHTWLPVLARQLPLPIPAPLAKGEPGAGYPFAWSVYEWMSGEPVTSDRIADLTRFATDLAGFLRALQKVDASAGPKPGTHNWFRGGSLLTYDNTVTTALASLTGLVDVNLVRRLWSEALEARWDGTEYWLHGDVAVGNLLLAGGELAGVIDFGTCGVGDPACDVAAGWTLFSGESRQVFREQLGVDDDMWARGRGWALWKTLDNYAAAVRAGKLREEGEAAAAIVDGILLNR